MLRNYSNTTIYLGIGLAIAALVIFYLVYSRSSSPPEPPKPTSRPAPKPRPPPTMKPPVQNPGGPPGHGPPPPGHGPPGGQGPPPGYGGPLPGHGQPGPPPGYGGPPPPSGPQMESYVGGGKPAMVLFYNSGCGHSRNMRPAWEQAKQQIQQSGQVDCVLIEDQAEMQKYGIRGFPTVKFFPNGLGSPNSVDYQGNRSAESLVTFARSGGSQT